jgi:ribosomal protein S18 acetylase RimI-like enzyme
MTTPYPTQMVERAHVLDDDLALGVRGDALRSLHAAGLRAAIGLDEPTLAGIAAAASEPHIVEFCPNDRTRFADVAAGRMWMAKGRGLVALTAADGALLAYGWSGRERNDHLPGADVTTAYRVTARGQLEARRVRVADPRFRLGLVLGDLVVATAVHVWGAPPTDVSLETWRSNAGARRVYADLGFARVSEAPDQPDMRPTLQPVGSEIAGEVVRADPDRPGRHVVADARCFYVLRSPA